MERRRLTADGTCTCGHSLAAHILTSGHYCGFCYCSHFHYATVQPRVRIEQIQPHPHARAALTPGRSNSYPLVLWSAEN